MIKLYDTMVREKREFVPREADRVTMYVCGPTVYGRAHIGNARPAVVFDTLRRLLEHEFPDRDVIYARNVTDVDDKIIAAAEAEGVGYRQITERYYRHYMDDMGALGVRPPTHEPRATAFIPEMIAMIEQLIAKGHAYEAAGHVLFNVPSDPEYGALSRRDRDAMIAGARVEVAPYKRDPSDFVLWKPAGESAQQVALSFPSPWGQGRPGWHIECSAMISAYFGQVCGSETIDIHGGGLDLVFPHHENELAQSRCAHGKPLANYWVHNGFVDMGAEKMSKSLGNVITPEELLKHHKGETLRLALLSAHYRSPLPWTESLISTSRRRLDRMYRKVGNAAPTKPDDLLCAALADDMNIPRALARLAEITDPGILKASGAMLGLLAESRETWEKDRSVNKELLAVIRGSLFIKEAGDKAGVGDHAEGEIRNPRIDALIAERTAAKAARDFATSDRIRDELKAEGILLEDGPDGTTWRRA